MTTEILATQDTLSHTEKHVHVAFDTPRRVLSSAVLNGGPVEADHLVNLRVPKRSAPTEAPETTLAQYSHAAGWTGTVVGMMTAASMASFRRTEASIQDIHTVVLVTAGLSNPRCAGDRADYRDMVTPTEPTGTINIIAITSACLTPAAMAEALMIITEAKGAVLRDAGIRSPVSDTIATGTGTDAVAVVSGHGPATIRYCGKHVLCGEILGRLVMDAVTPSIRWDLDHRKER